MDNVITIIIMIMWYTFVFMVSSPWRYRIKKEGGSHPPETIPEYSIPTLIFHHYSHAMVHFDSYSVFCDHFYSPCRYNIRMHIMPSSIINADATVITISALVVGDIS